MSFPGRFATAEGLPSVIEIEAVPKTECEMIARLLKKLPAPTSEPMTLRPTVGHLASCRRVAMSQDSSWFNTAGPYTQSASLTFEGAATKASMGVFQQGLPGQTPSWPMQDGFAQTDGRDGWVSAPGSGTMQEEHSTLGDDVDHADLHLSPSSLCVDDIGPQDQMPSMNIMPKVALTTLMVRNVPVMYTQELLMQEWSNAGAYDFIYLPRKGLTNLSYAFINFVSEAHALAFKTQWHKKRLAHFTSRKPLNINYADVQGLFANILQLKNKRLRRIELRQCLPFIVIQGVQVDLVKALAIAEAGLAH